MCDRCKIVKPRSGEPCGGPLVVSATKTSCARCVHAHKSCSFNLSQSAAARSKRKTRHDEEDEDEDEGSSGSARTKSRSVDGDESDGVMNRPVKRMRSSRRTGTSPERFGEEQRREDDSALGAEVRQAYEALGRGYERLLLVQLRANRALSQAAGGGGGLFQM